MSTIYYKAILEAIPPSQFAGERRTVFGTAFENQTVEEQARHIGLVGGLGTNKIISLKEYTDGESWYNAQYRTEKLVCKHCQNGTLQPMVIGDFRAVCEGYLICHHCGAVYGGRDAYEKNQLFGIYKPPKGAVALLYAVISHEGSPNTPRLEWCDKTITVEGKLLNCILDHTGEGRIHQARAFLNGVWVEVTWDLGNKKKEKESK